MSKKFDISLFCIPTIKNAAGTTLIEQVVPAAIFIRSETVTCPGHYTCNNRKA